MKELQGHNCIFRWITPVRCVRFAGLLLCVLFAVCLCSFTVHADRLYEPVEAVIPFDCINKEGVKNASFRIRMKAEKQGVPVPQNSLITLDKAGKGEFRITVSEPGTYVYRVFQEKGSDTAVRYDDTKYDVHVCVLNGEDDKLIYTVSVNYADTDVKPTTLAFENAVASDRREPATEAEVPTTEITTEGTTEGKTERTTEGTSEKTSEAAEGDAVQTGDESGIYFELFFLSLGGILLLLGIRYIFRKGGQHE